MARKYGNRLGPRFFPGIGNPDFLYMREMPQAWAVSAPAARRWPAHL